MDKNFFQKYCFGKREESGKGEESGKKGGWGGG